MATIVDVTGATYPKEYNGNTILPCEGESPVPSFASAYGRRAPLFWEHEGGAQGVRKDAFVASVDVQNSDLRRRPETESKGIKLSEFRQQLPAGSLPHLEIITDGRLLARPVDDHRERGYAGFRIPRLLVRECAHCRSRDGFAGGCRR
ncbi:MAG TPA: hypothetical protein VK577_10665 [Bradyrhizobium sp.]|jgi:hypothetical protein|nr:hypothetical protein [Bradyrhizobium sp.]